MKKYYVKTDYVPERNKHLFTEGKEYEVYFLSVSQTGGIIPNDRGTTSVVYIPECRYLDDKPWTLIEKEEGEE